MTTTTTIGLICSTKKRKNFFEPFREYCAQQSTFKNLSVVYVDLDDPVEVDVLFLKVTDQMNLVELELEAKHKMDQVKNYIEKHPNMLVIENLESVERVLDRVLMFTFLREALSHSCVVHVPGMTVFSEEDVLSVDDLRRQFERDQVEFPVICKTVVACGKSSTHDMAMVFNEHQLLELLESELMILPIVAQQFVNHDAVLFKGFAIGSEVFVQERVSLRNVNLNESRIITFNTQGSLPKELLSDDCLDVNAAFKNPKPLIEDELMMQTFRAIASDLTVALDMQLYGFDLVKQTDTDKFFVVDVNYLPGYVGVDNVNEMVLNHIMQRYEQFPKRRHHIQP